MTRRPRWSARGSRALVSPPLPTQTFKASVGVPPADQAGVAMRSCDAIRVVRDPTNRFKLVVQLCPRNATEKLPDNFDEFVTDEKSPYQRDYVAPSGPFDCFKLAWCAPTCTKMLYPLTSHATRVARRPVFYQSARRARKARNAAQTRPESKLYY